MIGGEPWFVLKDICEILELKNPTVVSERLDSDERSKFNLGRQGESIIILAYLSKTRLIERIENLGDDENE